jgi:2-oxoglutarate dehydrogenase E2 component (dihydrolipoamide succinyltransferase)
VSGQNVSAQVAEVPAPVVTPVSVPAPQPVVSAPAPQPAAVPAPPATAAAVSQPQDAYVTPIVRKLANELGINLANVRGTGIGGRIRKEDLQALAPQSAAPSVTTTAAAATPSAPRPAAPVASPLRGTTVTMSRLRKVIAARMVESLQVSAQLTTVIEVDVTKIARLRDRSKATFEAREGVKLSFLPFFSVAVCEALKQHPVLNSSVEGDQIIYHGAEHLGIAVDTERGLLVPVIHNAGDLNMGGVARKIAITKSLPMNSVAEHLRSPTLVHAARSLIRQSSISHKLPSSDSAQSSSAQWLSRVKMVERQLQFVQWST